MVSLIEAWNGFKASFMNIGFFRQVREINKKYATPKIKTTPMVKVALFILRVYLILLVLLLGYKFFTMARGGGF